MESHSQQHLIFFVLTNVPNKLERISVANLPDNLV
jgi:hypothetical protein